MKKGYWPGTLIRKDYYLIYVMSTKLATNVALIDVYNVQLYVIWLYRCSAFMAEHQHLHSGYVTGLLSSYLSCTVAFSGLISASVSPSSERKVRFCSHPCPLCNAISSLATGPGEMLIA